MHNRTKLGQKIVATVLLFCLMVTDFAGLGIMLVSYATEEPVVTSEDIVFTTSISSATAEKQTAYIAGITEDSLTININVGVKGNGYLKSPVLEIVDLENQMFTIKGELLSGDFIQLVDANKLYFNQINSGTEMELNIPIEYKANEEFDINKLNSVVNFNLTGTYVNAEGEAVEITGTSSVQLGWNNETAIQLTSSVEKYVPYNQDGVDYALVQLKVESGLVEGTQSFPIKDSTISLDVPQIEGATIVGIGASALNTSLTNGLQGSDVIFTEDNWEYVQAENKVNIYVANNSDSTLYNVPTGKDEYVVSIIYSNVNLGENTLLNGNVSLSTNVFSSEGIKNIAGSNMAQYDLTEQTGSIVTYSVTGQTVSASKGNIYANYNVEETAYETEYTNLLSINISRPEVVNIVEVREKDEYFTDASGNKFPTATANGYETYYKTTTINKDNLNVILGENGNLQILDENNNSLVTINKDTPCDENGNIIINYNKSVGKIVLQVNNPETEGILNVVNTKAIGKLSYGKVTAIGFNRLTSEYIAAAMYDGDVKGDLESISSTVELTGTKTNATISLSRNELSTLVENKDVEMNISLNNYNDTTDLYRNPVFEITFPEEIKEITIKTMNVLYGNEELQVSNLEAYKNENGNVVIRVSVQGTQTQYSLGEVTDGTTIILNSDIKLDKYTTSGIKNIKMNYYNEIATAYENSVEWAMAVSRTENTLLATCGEANIPLKVVAPSGVLNVQEISNYNAEVKESLYSINQGEVSATLPTYKEESIATMKITMMNNSEDVMQNVSILGRTAFKGNTSITTNEDLGTTIDCSMLTEISELQNAGKEIKIYYSENPNATKDLDNAENGWVEELKSYTNVKSYLIVIGGEVAVGEIVSFKYQYMIPAQLSANNVVVATMATNYTAQGVDTVAEAHKVVLKTVEEPVLTVETTSDAGEEVKEGQIITYTVTVRNDGKAEARDIKVTSLVAEGTTYLNQLESGEYELREDITELTLDIGVVEAGVAKSVSYKVRVNDKATEEIEQPDSIEDNTQKITSTAQVEAEGLEKPIYTQSKEVEVEKAEAKVEISEENYTVPVMPGEEIELNIQAGGTEIIKNAKIESKLPNEVEFIDAYAFVFEEDGVSIKRVECATYNKETHTVTYSFDKLALRTVKLKVKIKEADEENKQITFKATVTGDGIDTYESNEWIHTVALPKLTLEFISEESGKYIKEGSNVKYILTVKNEGLAPAEDLTFTSVIPEGLDISAANYQYNDRAKSQMLITDDRIARTTFSILAGDTVTLTLSGKASKIDVKELQVQTMWTITGEDIETITSDTITQIVQDVEKVVQPTKTEEPKKVTVESTKETETKPTATKTTENKTYRITGKAWNDKDEDGKKDSNEPGLSGVTVKLYNAANNRQVSKGITDGSGEYVFSGLSEGSYYIVFGYNTSKYKLTTYHVKGSNSSSNSDAISTNGLAITDKISISGKSQGDIDIGLVESKMFDLSLEKTVKKITVQTEKGVKAYDYNNVSTAKVDIRAQELAGAKVYIEYYITVANKGELTGYAKTIVDYLPEGMIFSQDLNPGWYQDANGNLYTNALKDKAIAAGQTMTVKLVLVKAMTEENTGIVNNIAEIGESFNESAIADIDSLAGNGVTTEDDLSSADVIISVNTGGGMVNVMVLITTLITLFIALYVIKLRIDRNNKGVITWEE